jgi:hypothetical protein
MHTSRRRGWLLAVGAVLAAEALAATLPMQVATLPTSIQAQLQQRQVRWQSLTPEQRTQLQQRMVLWDSLPADEREERRARYAAWRALDEPVRARLRAAAERFASLPPEQQRRLRDHYDGLDRMQRIGWRLGPELGADFPRLQPLFGFVSEDERQPLLTLLRQLNAEQRDDLAVLAQRIPPQDRAAFRKALLQVAPEQRGAWLKQQRDQ